MAYHFQEWEEKLYDATRKDMTWEIWKWFKIAPTWNQSIVDRNKLHTLKIEMKEPKYKHRKQPKKECTGKNMRFKTTLQIVSIHLYYNLICEI